MDGEGAPERDRLPQRRARARLVEREGLAGTVEVRTVLSTPVSHGEHILTLGQPQPFGEYNVTLIEVSPTKTEDAVPESSYRFTFEIEKI